MWPSLGIWPTTHNPDTCPDWESNRWPFALQPVLNPLSYTSQGCFINIWWRVLTKHFTWPKHISLHYIVLTKIPDFEPACLDSYLLPWPGRKKHHCYQNAVGIFVILESVVLNCARICWLLNLTTKNFFVVLCRRFWSFFNTISFFWYIFRICDVILDIYHIYCIHTYIFKHYSNGKWQSFITMVTSATCLFTVETFKESKESATTIMPKLVSWIAWGMKGLPVLFYRLFQAFRS